MVFVGRIGSLLLVTLAVLTGCRATSRSLSINGDSFSPKSGIRSGDAACGSRTTSKPTAVDTPPASITTSVSAGSRSDDSPARETKADLPSASRSRFVSWLAQRVRRRTEAERIPVPITETPAVETASHTLVDEF